MRLSDVEMSEGVIAPSDSRAPLFMQGVMTDVIELNITEDGLRGTEDEIEIRVAQRTEELARANEDLRHSAEQFKRFAYSAVHDLKGPAIGTYGLTKLLYEQYRDALDERGRQYCRQIMRASEHIAELIEKMNAYIATKEAPLRIEPIKLNDILQVLRDEFSAELSLRGIEWIEPNGPIEIWADRLSLLRVFGNYVDNALKYGGEQLSEIRIAHQESNGFHVFSVKDDGRGISEKDPEKLFRMFQRNGSSKGIEGAGLGLAIAKEMAERHQGRAWVESGLRKGAAFYFSIARDLHRKLCKKRRNPA